MEPTKSIYLQLGDIIQLKAPSNEELNEHIFIIDYIDNKKIKLRQQGVDEITILNINEDSNLSDESILVIDILSHAETNSYSKQHKLLPGTYVDVHFNGDLPLTITGEITNLEEDMIEIKINETNELIYIDFGYKGIPEDIPIEKIVIRSKPDTKMTVQDGDEIPIEDEVGIEGEVGIEYEADI